MECVQNLRVNDAQQSNSALWLVLSGSMLNSERAKGCRWLFFFVGSMMALDHPQSEHGAVT